MALTGTLADMRVIDLLQYPHAGRKTGELLVRSPREEGRCYYQQGRLLHAVAGTLEGIDALVEILGWGDGDFEFHNDVGVERRTIEGDLHRAIMEALKTRDERRKAAPQEPARSDLLDRALAQTPSILEACVVDVRGHVIARAHRPGAPPVPAPLLEALGRAAQEHPRHGLRRILLEDEAGLVVLHRLPDGRSLLLCADHAATIGAVSLVAAKVSQSLAGGAP